jgi:hypothetical protein
VIHCVDCGDCQAVGIGVAPCQVRWTSWHRQYSQQPSVGLEHPNPQRDGNVDPSSQVDLHAVGATRFTRVDLRKNAAGADPQRSIRFDIKCPDVLATGIAHVEGSLVG